MSIYFARLEIFLMNSPFIDVRRWEGIS